METIDEIKDLFGRVEEKSRFINDLSMHVPVKPSSIKVNWLCDSGFWSIPEEYQKTVLAMLRERVGQQEWMQKHGVSAIHRAEQAENP